MTKEFNFDELDKAVNSLIGDKAKQPTSAQPMVSPSQPVQSAVPPAPSPAASAITTPPRANNAPVLSRNIPAVERTTPAIQPASTSPLPPSPAKPVAEKPGTPGRFMDVMHPVSDMATPAKEEIKKGIGAEGKTVEPLSSDIAPEPLPEKSAANTPNSAQLSTQAPVNPDAMVTTPDTEEKEWKDPLEEVTKNEQKRELRDGAKERLGLTPEEDIKDDKLEEMTDKKPLFLPDAKVEKRPLGAFAEDDKSEEKTGKYESEKKKEDTSAKLMIDGVTDTESDKDKTDEESIELLLPELGKEIVAVEAGDAIAGDEEPVKPKEQAMGKKEDNKKASAKPETFSIPKQYKEKPASTEHKPKSIYDTEEYHRSLATAAAKKKKGSKWWVWVLIILGLLVLGVGLGAGAYFLVGI